MHCRLTRKQKRNMGWHGRSGGGRSARTQGTGVGAALFAAAEAAARAHQPPALVCTVVDKRPEMIAFYKRRGMVPTGRTLPYLTPERLRDGLSMHFIELIKRYGDQHVGVTA